MFFGCGGCSFDGGQGGGFGEARSHEVHRHTFFDGQCIFGGPLILGEDVIDRCQGDAEFLGKVAL